MKISIGIVDDHQLFLKSLGLMLENFNEFNVVLMAMNGKDLQEKISIKNLPDIILIDVNMPVMDGIATAKWLSQTHPSIKLVALSMNDSDRIIIEMIKAGCCAYLLKDTHPNELEKALHEIYAKGFYNSDVSNINYRRLLLAENDPLNITEKEKIFLQHACSDMTYKQIASEMNLSERTIDGYRENLFHKFKVQSRVGLALEAIRKNWVKL
ncbi:MAG: response regulator transcription factor [Bacteroidota bacterium]|nr:response regulator transcription factor [Bacteroidota bacterium]